jgi:hypothetical protein
LIRRGVVLPTTDENANMTTIFEPKAVGEKIKETAAESEDKTTEIIEETERSAVDENSNSAILEAETDKDAEPETSETDVEKNILTEETAIIELHAIPLYFPTSYSLVKPYVQGFEMNTLDAPSLKSVTIDNNWQPKKNRSES